jgi:hypothetical protein
MPGGVRNKDSLWMFHALSIAKKMSVGSEQQQ